MNFIDYLLKKAIVTEYYRKNVFFFLGIILLAFGFLRGQEHITLAKHILQYNSLLAYVLLIWLGYSLKVMFYILRTINLEQNRFLFNLVLFPKKTRLLALAKVQFQLLFPVILYAMFMIIVAWIDKRFISIGVILIFFVLNILFSIILLEVRFSKPPQTDLNPNSFVSKKRFFRLRAVLFFPLYLIKNEPILFLLSKIGSFFFIIFTFWLYPTDQYDLRLFGLMIIVLVAINIQIVITFFNFWEGTFSFFRNLPIGNFSIFKNITTSYFLILIPEILFIFIRGYPYFSLMFSLILTIYFLSFVLLLHFFQYLYIGSYQARSQVYFFGFFIIFILVMFKIPLWVFSILFLVFTLFIISFKFKKYEYKSEK